MFDSFRGTWKSQIATLSRRQWLRRSGALAALGLLDRQEVAASPVAPSLRAGPDIYRSIGVRPLINCRGTLTVISGSLELPEVRAAKEAAAQHYVQLDELMEAIGKRLAALTGAEWGIVTSGCAAAMAHSTAACVAGGNPDRHVRIPNLAGFAKDEVIIPKHSRNVYDSAIRSIGVRIVEVESVAEYESALGPRTAMVYVFAGPRVDSSPLNLETLARLANERKVPVMVDAAAEILTIPNVHLARGATMVAYSGGKCLRGPQCAGILLGRKDLVRSAWIHSAPHHGYGRSMKVGKEEIVGMLMAVEMWVKRDHEAEWRRWVSWMNHIAGRVTVIPGITAEVRQEPRGLSNRSPGLTIRWDSEKLGITGREVSDILWNTEPRIALGGGGGRSRGGGTGTATETGVSITAYMMEPGEEKIVADRLHALLSNPPKRAPAPPARPPAADVTGRWDVEIEFAGSVSTHAFHLRQQDGRVEGTHQGDYVSRDLSGSLEGDAIEVSSSYTEEHGDSLMFRFSGKVAGDMMSGELDMGEYLMAKWTARRHRYGRA
jgi:L-seryl-tRNA(Ser) seleniumtransferase